MPPFIFRCNWPYDGRETRRVILGSFLVTVVVCCILLLLNGMKGGLDGDVWDRLERKRKKAASCETVNSDEFLNQRANSLSNFSFFFVALVLGCVAWRDWKCGRRGGEGGREGEGERERGGQRLVDGATRNPAVSLPNPIVAYPEHTVLLSISCHAMCYTSFIWHASTTVVGANIDYGAMYLMLITLTGLGVMRTCAFIDESQRRLKAAAVALCYVVAGVTMFAMKTKLKGQTYIIVGLILTVGASFTVSSLGALALRRASPRTNPVFGLLSFLSVGLAYLLRTMDKVRPSEERATAGAKRQQSVLYWLLT